MPKAVALKRAREDAREGKAPSTQAGEFIREEMHALKKGSGNVRSRKQAIAIGLSEARRSGIKLGQPKSGPTTVRKKAARDNAVGQGRAKPSASRSRGAKKPPAPANVVTPAKPVYALKIVPRRGGPTKVRRNLFFKQLPYSHETYSHW